MKMATSKAPPEQEITEPRSFRDILGELNNGELETDLSLDFAALIRTVRGRGVAGEITLTLKVKPNGPTVLISADYKAKEPPKPRGESLFFDDEAGNLTRSNKKQTTLNLREVPQDPPTPIREVK
jgi:hypothetical protein